MSTVRLLVALTLCAHALATTSELAATFYPYTAEEELALAPANWHPELGSANSSQVTEWLTALQQLETSATGHVNYITSVCSIESNCTRALEVVVSEWAPNADNDPLQPIDCSAYLLVAATTPIAGDNYAWTQEFNPQNEFLVQPTSPSSADGSCTWTVQYTPSTIAAMDAAIQKENSRRRKLLCQYCTGSVGGCLPESACGTCFPGEASVMLEDGSQSRMTDLSIGDKVAVLGKDGNIMYDHVYAFGHQDKTAAADFVTLALKGSAHVIQLTGRHFIPVAAGPHATRTFKRARDVVVGDLVWALPNSDGQSSGLYQVTDVTTENMLGLYNPFTLSGSIIVNGVVASVHSDWFLDSIADRIGWASVLPDIYQVILAPARMLWYTLGRERYMALYSFLDNQVGGLDKFGTSHGGKIAGTTLVASSVLAGGIFMRQAKKQVSIVKA